MANQTPPDLAEIDLFSLLRTIADGVSIANADGRIIYSNPAADRILGTSASDRDPEEWTSHYGVYVPNSDLPFPAESFPLVRALAGEEVQDFETLIRSPARPGDVIISSSARPLRDEDGTITGAVVVFRDITRLRHAQRALERTNQELQETQRLKEELTAFLLHDLKNPLTSISVLAELMLEDGLDCDRLRTDVQGIRDAAERMHRMTIDLLDIQMAEDGALQPELEEIVAGELLEEVRKAERVRGHGLRVEATDPALVLRGDRDLLVRVLVNLVDNCIKYGPPDGRITLDAVVAGPDRLLLRVQDEGSGVPPALRERIFEKYARIERTQEPRTRYSRGLGLRFCKVVVEALDGRIWVEDAEPRGARFCVELPVPRGR